MEQILHLFRSKDITNHKLALVLIKSQELDLYEIVRIMFHDKSFWVVFDWTSVEVIYSLFIDELDFTINLFNKDNEFIFYFIIYDVKGKRQNYYENPSEEEMVRTIVKTLESIT